MPNEIMESYYMRMGKYGMFIILCINVSYICYIIFIISFSYIHFKTLLNYKR